MKKSIFGRRWELTAASPPERRRRRSTPMDYAPYQADRPRSGRRLPRRSPLARRAYWSGYAITHAMSAPPVLPREGIASTAGQRPLSMMTGLRPGISTRIFHPATMPGQAALAAPSTIAMNLKNDHADPQRHNVQFCSTCRRLLRRAVSAHHGDKALCGLPRGLIRHHHRTGQRRARQRRDFHPPGRAVERLSGRRRRKPCKTPPSARCQMPGTSIRNWISSSTTISDLLQELLPPARRSRTASSSASTATTEYGAALSAHFVLSD